MTPQDAGFVEWFGEHLWALWAVAGLGLAAAEMLTLDLTLLMLGCGALAGAAVAALAPTLVWLQAIVAAVTAVAMLGLVRPKMLRRLGSAAGYRSALDKMVGSEGVATREVTRAGGEVKVNGETWSARTMDSSTTIAAGAEVEVYEVDGATLVVYPVSGGELLGGMPPMLEP